MSPRRSTPSAARRGTRSDTATVGRSLARAFADDPVATWAAGRGFLPEPMAGRFFRAQFRTRLPHVHVAGEGRGVAVWVPPGEPHHRLRTALPVVPAVVMMVRRRLLVAAKALNAIDRVRPRDDHWYLETLGTDPGHQGRGLASAALAPVLDRADEEGVPAYLESSKEANLAFYRRHGFEEITTVDLPPDGPRVWLMWRDPLPPPQPARREATGTRDGGQPRAAKSSGAV